MNLSITTSLKTHTKSAVKKLNVEDSELADKMLCIKEK